MVLGASIAMILPAVGLCQKQAHADTIPTSRFFELNEYFIQMPLGQTFISPAPCPGATIARYHLPTDKPNPICDVDTTPQQHLRTTL